MKNEGKNSAFNLILTAICIFVGVGFITGAEIWFYFARFGGNMLFGLLIFGLLCFFIVYFALGEGDQCTGACKFKHWGLGFSELLVASAMVSGLLDISRNLFGSWWVLIFLLAIFVMIFVFIKGLKSMIIYNYFVAIFIVFVITCLFLFNNENVLNFKQNFIFSYDIKSIFLACGFSVIYIFMNSAEMRPILSKYDSKNKRKNKVVFSLLFTLLLIFLISTLSYFLIVNNSIANLSMPFLLLFNNCGDLVKFIFLTGLVLALISTAVACLVGLKEKVNFNKKY